MEKNKVRLWEFLGLAAVLLAMKVSSLRKPRGRLDAKTYVTRRKAARRKN